MSSEQDELLDRNYPIQEDMRFQEKLWKLERVGWIALTLVVTITLLGVFGYPSFLAANDHTSRSAPRSALGRAMTGAGSGRSTRFHRADAPLSL